MNRTNDQYMHDILMRAGYHEIDESLREFVVDRVWEALKDTLSQEISHWNRLCRSTYDAPEKAIDFYPNACEIAHCRPLWIDFEQALVGQAIDSLPNEIRKGLEWLRQSPDLGAPSPADTGGICAQTVRKGIADKPLARIWIWKQSGSEDSASQIHYCYDLPTSTQGPDVLDVPVEAGAIPEGEKAFVRDAVEKLLLPLMEG